MRKRPGCVPGYVSKWFLQLDEEKLRQYLEKTVSAGLWNSPTLVVNKRRETDIDTLERQPELRYFPQSRKGWWRKLSYSVADDAKEHREKRQYVVRRLQEAGAGLLLATDMPDPYVVPGFSIHEELQRFVESGLTPYEAIKTGTYNTAKFLKKLDRFGTIEKGKDADLILLRANPLQDVSNIKNPLGVMAKGRWYPREVLDKMLTDIETEIADHVLESHYAIPLHETPPINGTFRRSRFIEQ